MVGVANEDEQLGKACVFAYALRKGQGIAAQNYLSPYRYIGSVKSYDAKVEWHLSLVGRSLHFNFLKKP